MTNDLHGKLNWIVGKFTNTSILFESLKGKFNSMFFLLRDFLGMKIYAGRTKIFNSGIFLFHICEKLIPTVLFELNMNKCIWFIIKLTIEKLIWLQRNSIKPICRHLLNGIQVFINSYPSDSRSLLYCFYLVQMYSTMLQFCCINFLQ